MEEEWDYLCSELGILEDKEKQDLIKRFVEHSNGEASEKSAEEIGTKLLLVTRLIYDDKTRKTVAPFMKYVVELINSQYLSEHIES